MKKVALMSVPGVAVMSETGITLTKALENAVSVSSTVMDIISGHELLFTLFASSLLFTGIKIIGGVKRASKK